MTRRRLIGAFLVTLTLARDGAAADKNFMADISKLLTSEDENRAKLDTHISDYFKDMQAVNAAVKEPGSLETTLVRAETKINDDKETLIENHLRIEFLNSFISVLEKSENPRKDSVSLLLDLAHKDIFSSIETGNESKTWLFEMYLSIAIRDLMEPSENFADFVKSYMVYSSVHEPHSPGQFLKTRSYIGAKPSLKSEKEKPKSTGN